MPPSLIRVGRAADDCFACSKAGPQSGTTCDRQRPRCNVCTDAGRVCSGYYLEIQWQGGASRASWRSPPVDVLTPSSGTAETATGPRKRGIKRSFSDRSCSTQFHPKVFRFIREVVEHDYIDTSFKKKHSSPEPYRGLCETDKSHVRHTQTRPTNENGSGSSHRSDGETWQQNFEPHGIFRKVQPASSADPSSGYRNLHLHTLLNSFPDRKLDSRIVSRCDLIDTARDHASGIRVASLTSPDASIGHLSSVSEPTHTVGNGQPYQSYAWQLRQHSDEEGPTTQRNQSWHENVGRGNSTPLPPYLGSPLNEADVVSPPSAEDIKSTPELTDKYDELLPRYEDISSDESSSLRPLLSSNPSWHALTAYELQRVQHYDQFVAPVPITLNTTGVMNPYREVLPYLHQIPALKFAGELTPFERIFSADDY